MSIKIILLKLLIKTGLIDLFNFTIKSTVNNTPVYIPLKGSMGYENVFLGEAWFSDIFKKLMINSSNQSVFVDVGVNIGQTILKIKSINPNINYVGIEPNVTCISYAHELVKVNDFTNISLYPVGFSSDNGFLKLYADNIHASGASVIKDFRRNGKKIQFEYNINVVKGDVLLKNISGPIKLIKIDVEGFESDVLKGLTQTMTTHRPVIMCEVLPVYSKSNNARLDRQLALEALLKENDYKLYLINENNSTISSIEEIGIHGDMGRTNYLFSHISDCQKLEAALFPRDA
jgi:FkbM family methyltransferase